MPRTKSGKSYSVNPYRVRSLVVELDRNRARQALAAQNWNEESDGTWSIGDSSSYSLEDAVAQMVDELAARWSTTEQVRAELVNRESLRVPVEALEPDAGEAGELRDDEGYPRFG